MDGPFCEDFLGGGSAIALQGPSGSTVGASGSTAAASGSTAGARAESGGNGLIPSPTI